MNLNSFEQKQKWNEKMYSLFPTKNVYENKSFIVRFIEQARVKTVLDFSDIQNSDKVIEIGCEGGYLLKKILFAQEIVGLDIARNALDDARKNVKSNKVKLICADASNIPLENCYFDKIICSQTLEHVDNPVEIVAEMYRIIKPNGIMVISIPHEKVLRGLKKIFNKIGLFRILFPKIETSTSAWHLQDFNKKKIYQILSRYFNVRCFKYVPVPFFGPEMVIKCKPKK